MSKNVPASAFSPTANDSRAALVVGGNRIHPATAEPGYWYVVVDLTNGLEVVANEHSADSSSPPANVAAMLGNSAYFLFFIAQRAGTSSLPQGDLASFLDAAGSGSQLVALQQSISLLGAESFFHASYVLAATLNDQDLPGFEESSLWNPCVLNMQFIPLEVDGKTIFAPVQIGTQQSPNMVRAVQSAGMAPSVVFGR
jgi:hypothetical protein